MYNTFNPVSPAYLSYGSYTATQAQKANPSLGKALQATKKRLKTFYHEQDDKALGLSLAFSGLCGAFFSASSGMLKTTRGTGFIYGIIGSIMAINLNNHALEMTPFGIPNPNHQK